MAVQQNVDKLATIGETPTESRREFNSLFAGYVIFAIIAVFGGVFVFNYRVNGVVPALVGQQENDEEGALAEDEELAAIAELQYQDTDGDGLSDFDETYTYETSRNLVDTDGDGLSDADEVNNGTNPNCATGNNCSGIRALTEEQSEITEQQVVESVFFDSEELSDDQLRSELINLGVPSETLENVSGDRLRDAYETVRGEYLEAGDAIGGTTDPSDIDPNDDITAEDQPDTSLDTLAPDATQSTGLGGATSLDEFAEYDADQVRDLLLQGGFDKAELDAIDDESLLQAYQEAIAAEQN